MSENYIDLTRPLFGAWLAAIIDFAVEIAVLMLGTLK